MFSPKHVAIVVGFAVALALTSFLTNEYAARRGEADRKALAVALSAVKTASSHAKAAEDRARIEASRGDLATVRASYFADKAKRSAAKAAEAWARFEEAASSNVCDSSCISAARDAHRADSVALASSDSALSSARSAAARYKLGLDGALQSLAELREASTQVVAATRPFASRPGRLRALLPSVGAGAAAGLDLNGKPNVVTGITFGWKF